MRPIADPVARAFINRFQGGFPITDRPFSNVAAEIGIGESALIQCVRTLLQRMILSRFGPLYDAEAMGGRSLLAALSVPGHRFDEVADLLNGMPEVAHNYARDHAFNMWFVIASDDQRSVDATLDRIGRLSGLEVLALPKLREFKIGLWIHLACDGSVDTVPLPAHALPPEPFAHPGPDAIDRRLIHATQAGLPLVPRPYHQLAADLELSPDIVMDRFRKLWAGRIIRRIGAVPHHYRLGLRGNGMTVWEVPAERIEAAGRRLAASPWVSHCYQRPSRGRHWPYTLFAMVHGQDRRAVEEKTRALARLPELRGVAYEILFSTRVLKKAGLRIAA